MSNSTKAYKLNKTFENSAFPLEQELKELNKNTAKSVFNSLAATVFSGVGTSFLFQNNCIPLLMERVFARWSIPSCSIMAALINIIIVMIVFSVLYIIGLLVCIFGRKFGRKATNKLYKKKETDDGIRELAEIFHKSIINDIITGISFVDKSAEVAQMNESMKNDSSQVKISDSIVNMYLYEAVYYFKQAKLQMEYMKLFDTNKKEINKKFRDEIGENTIKTTCKVFYDGLCKLYDKIDDGTEKELIRMIKDGIKPYRI